VPASRRKKKPKNSEITEEQRVKLLREIQKEAEFVGARRAELKSYGMIYQASYKESAARRERLPIDTFYSMPFDRWMVHNTFHAKAFADTATLVEATWRKMNVAYCDVPMFRFMMGYDCGGLLSEDELLDLPWPDDVPVLVESDVDGYCEELGGKQHLWTWLEVAFGIETEEQQLLYNQFVHLLLEVFREFCHDDDKETICLSAVPTTPGCRGTVDSYAQDTVAEWWNVALRRLGYDV